MPIFTRVLSAVADAVPILSEIAQWADRHFGASPDPAKQAKVDAALTRCRKALVAANRAATAASNPADAGAAMAEFKAAWGDLRAALQGLPGVSNLPVATGEPGRLGLVDSKTGETLSVPEPLALTAEAQQ